MDNRIIIAIVSVMVVIVLGLGGLIVFTLDSEDDDTSFSNFETEEIEFEEGGAIDSGARIEIERLRLQIEDLNKQVEALNKRVVAVENRPAAVAQPQASGGGGIVAVPRDGPNQIIDSYAQVVLIAQRREVNKGIRIASPSYLESVFGKPREVLTSNCQSMTNKRLSDKLVLETVGPIRVRMLRPAVESLRRVFNNIEATDPDLYARINTAGSLCVRHIRGAPGRTSTHAFGLSLDLNIDGKLDVLGDGKTQLGLTIIKDFFKNEGWYWGAGFSREDSMHFEVSRDMVEKWVAEGKL